MGQPRLYQEDDDSDIAIAKLMKICQKSMAPVLTETAAMHIWTMIPR